MRIVIVEDEVKTRTGLEKIITKYTSHEVAASVCDGKQGIEAVCSLCPDVVITDIRMPNMDGLTMLEKIREKEIGTRAVLLTGFSDFEYARRSLQLGADEYLLKPLNVEDILEVLERLEGKLAKIKREEVSGEQMLFSLLNAKGEEVSEYAARLEQHMHIMSKEKLCMILIRVSSMMKETINEVVSKLEEILPSVCLLRYEVFPLQSRQSVLIMIPGGQRMRYLKELFRMHVLPEIGEIGECMAIYGELKEMVQLPQKLDRMTEDFEYGFALESGSLIDETFVSSVRYENVEYPVQLEQIVCREIRSGNQEKTKEIAKKFREQVIESRSEPCFIREYTVRFLMAAVNISRDRKTDKEAEGLYHVLLHSIMNSSTREKLLYEYEKIWEHLICEKRDDEKTDNGIVLNVIELIRKNYDKDLSLSAAAEHVGLSPEYLSRLFAREMGINFSTFLGDFRISAAKRMLADERYKIYEIAETVGFRDTKYFNKVFRSVTGISPSEYRKSLR